MIFKGAKAIAVVKHCISKAEELINEAKKMDTAQQIIMPMPNVLSWPLQNYSQIYIAEMINLAKLL